MISAIEMALGGMIYEQGLIKIGTEVEAILMVLLIYLKGRILAACR
jgi:hypothetical protein